MADEDAQNFFVPDPLRDLRLDALHHFVELVGRFEVGEVRDFLRGGDKDVLNVGALLIELAVEEILLLLLCGERFDFELDGAGPGRKKGQQEQAKAKRLDHMGALAPRIVVRSRCDSGLQGVRSLQLVKTCNRLLGAVGDQKSGNKK